MVDAVTMAIKKATPQLAQMEKEGILAWGAYKDTRVNHLLKIPSLSRLPFTNWRRSSHY